MTTTTTNEIDIDTQIDLLWHQEEYYPFEQVAVPWAVDYYEFASPALVGEPVRKGVVFQRSEETPYQLDLVYGDVHPDIKVDTNAVANNKEVGKLLLTIAIITIKCLHQHPGCYIKLNGISPARTRIYRRVINKYLNAFATMVSVHGQPIGLPHMEQITQQYNDDYAYMIVKAKELPIPTLT